MAPIAHLTVRLSAQIAEFQSEFKTATKSAQKFADDFEGTATKAAAVGAFFGTIAADIAKSIAAGLGNALRDAVKFSSEFSNAFIGLGSVARAFGTDTDLATAAARRLSADGLLPLKDSATGLKNLLAAGFNLEQSTKLMDAFKDSAAFGRQGALSFGDAVRSATEGVKNGNSILVDNAGVTKNLSQILKEAGFSAQDLSRASSDVGVRMALFNGILKETAAQTGDAAKLTQTYTGQVTRLDSQYTQLLASIGDSITQNKNVAQAIGFVGDAVQNLTLSLGKNGTGFNLVSDAIILFVKAASASLGVIDLLQTGFAGLQIAFSKTAESALGMARQMLTYFAIAQRVRGQVDPIGGAQASREAALAEVAIAHLTRFTHGYADAAEDAKQRSIAWGNALQGGVAKMDGLVKQLESARGQSVALGDNLARVGTSHTTAASGASSHGKATDALAKKFAALNPKMVEGIDHIGQLGYKFKIAIPDVQSFAEMLPRVESGISDVISEIPKLDLGYQFDRAMPKVLDLDEAIGALAQSLANLSQIAGGSLGAIAGGLGSLVGALDTARRGTDALKAGLSAFKAGEALAGIAGMASGIMGIFTAAMSAVQGIKAIWSALDRNKGRDLVEDFAGEFGGFDALHEKLLTIGEAGEELWIKLTQGVGRNNPAQAQAAIDEVREALAKQKQAQDNATISTEAGAQATIETATQAALALDELSARLLVNASEWGDWSKTVTGYISELASTIRSIPIPSLSTGGGSGSPAAPASSVSSGAAGINVTVVSQLDGREVARNQARYLPSVLAGAGL